MDRDITLDGVTDYLDELDHVTPPFKLERQAQGEPGKVKIKRTMFPHTV